VKNYFAIYSADSTDDLGNAVVLLHKQIQGRTINGWLILAAVLGAAIVVADGLTRAPDPEYGLPLQPLEYKPNHAAFLLAALALPLMFAYAKKAQVPLSEAMFLWFTFCTTAYTKDFSYLRLPGAPLFVTDIVLVALLFWIYILPRSQNPRSPLGLNIFLALFATAGVVAAARGFWGNGETTLVLRDSALVAYAFFLLVGYHLFRNWTSIKRFAAWFLLGTALSVLNGLAWFVVVPGQRRFVLPGIYVLVSLVIVLMATANRLIRKKAGCILAVVFSLGLLLANTRSVFVSLGTVLLFCLIVPGLLRVKIRSASLVKALITAAMLVCAVVFFSLRLKTGRDFSTRVADEQSSGILHTSDDPYWQFRLAAWTEAWKRFEQYPPCGEGFGIPFVFDIYDNDARPHNTFLTVLYKMGLFGFLPFFAFLAYFFWGGLRAVLRNSANRGAVFLQIVILAQLSFCVYGGASFVVESPYLASLFWAGMGIGLRVIKKLDWERSFRSSVDRCSLNASDLANRACMSDREVGLAHGGIK
jgi:O-antigen ligase